MELTTEVRLFDENCFSLCLNASLSSIPQSEEIVFIFFIYVIVEEEAPEFLGAG